MKSKKTVISTALIVAAVLAANVFGIGCGSGDNTADSISNQNNAIVSQTEEINLGADETVDEKASETSSGADETVDEKASETKSVEIVYKFRNKSLWKEHFEKHGSEFPYDTKEEYLEGANIMMANENKLHKTEKEDGDDVYYLEETNEFIIISGDGYLRTYFKPSRGKAYFDSQ